MTFKLLRRQFTLIVFVFLIVSSTTLHVAIGAYEGYTRLVVVVSDDSILASAERSHSNPKSIETSLNPYLMSEAEKTLNNLRSAGIDFRIVEVLTYAIHAVVIDVPAGQVHGVRSVIEPQRVHKDTILHVDLDNKPSLGVLADELQANTRNLTGAGILVAVIDTGVDYTHKDLGGAFGIGNKVVGGYDYVDNDGDPKDLDGHGTHVSGIIAADGQFKGIAPKAKILAYRVVGERGNVRTSDVTRAIDRAIRDGARVINLSLGSPSGIDILRRVISSAARNGIIIVAAVGNSGPTPGSIGSPASQYSAITVGSSFIPLDSELRVEGQKDTIQSRAMLGSRIVNNPISGELVFVKFARPKDVDGIDLTGKIAIAERGTDNPNERVFFSIKEETVSSKGAIGLVIFNNQPGIFDGSLLHQDNPPGYYPQIPVVSTTRELGLAILEQMKKESVRVSIKIEPKPEQVADSSSRGPVSSFYAKPDLVAPGIAVISTAPNGKYSALSGTSFSAPYVTGTVALMLEKRNFTKTQLVGMLAATAQPLTNASTTELFSINEQGSGRLDVKNAITSPVTVAPHQIFAHLAPDQTFFSRAISIESISNTSVSVQISSLWKSLQIEASLSPQTFTLEAGKTALLNVTTKLLNTSADAGTKEGRFTMLVSRTDGGANTLTLPIAVTINRASIILVQTAEGYQISVSNRQPFKDYRMTIRTPEGELRLDQKANAGTPVQFTPTTKGEYWVEAEITDGNNKLFARGIINSQLAVATDRTQVPNSTSEIPVRFMQILFGSITLVSIGSAAYLLVSSKRRRVEEI